MDRSGYWLRGLTGLLLALNLGVAVLGLMMHYWPAHAPVLPAMNADQIHLALTTPAIKPQASLGPSPELAGVPAVPDMTQAAGHDEGRCLVWHKLDPERLFALEKAVRQQGLKADDYVWALDDPLGWWVYLAPFADAVKMRAAIEEVRQRGVTDAGPVHGGTMANAVSLGVFSELEKARQHAELMTRKGIKEVRYGLRPKVESVRLILPKPATPELSEAIRLASRGALPDVCSIAEAR